MRTQLLTVAIVTLTMSVTPMALAQSNDVSPQEYVAMAASSDAFEIQSSEMALQHAKSAQVKKFAQEMIDHHSMTTANLKAAAQKEDIGVPSSPMPKQAQMLAQLKGTSDASFDATYVELQRSSHQEALALHSAYARNGDDAALKAVAAKAVPIVEKHYQEVQTLSGS